MMRSPFDAMFRWWKPVNGNGNGAVNGNGYAQPDANGGPVEGVLRIGVDVEPDENTRAVVVVVQPLGEHTRDAHFSVGATAPLAPPGFGRHVTSHEDRVLQHSVNTRSGADLVLQEVRSSSLPSSRSLVTWSRLRFASVRSCYRGRCFDSVAASCISSWPRAGWGPSTSEFIAAPRASRK